MHPIRRERVSDAATLWLANGLVAVLRFVARICEITAPPHKKARLRALREQMQALDRDKKLMLKQIENRPGSEMLQVLDDFMERHGMTEDREDLTETRQRLRAMEQESEALQQIRLRAGEDKAVAAEGFREYIQEHPNSRLAYSYLAGILKEVGDWEGSIVACREAIRLAEDEPLSSASARLHLGEILQEMDNLDAAVAEYQRIVDEANSDTEDILCMAYLRLGDVLKRKGDMAEARRAWKQAIRWDTTGIAAKEAKTRLKNP